MFYHGVVNGLVRNKILKILEQQEISSASRMEYSKQIGFNENNYVSVCVNLGNEVYSEYPNNAFNSYIINHFCFVIDDSITAEPTEYLADIRNMGPFELNNLKRQNPNKRYSDIIDEYQVKDYIHLSKVIAIGIPYNIPENDGFIKLSDFCYLTREEFDELVREVEDIANSLGLKIVDSTSECLQEICNDKPIRIR